MIDQSILEVFGEKSRDGDKAKGLLLKALMRNNYQEGGEVENRIDLGNLISSAESSSTGSWQESNITPPTGKLPSERDAMQDLHTVLGLSGMIPGVGNVADIVDASIYGLEGKGGEAALSLTSALPIAGLLAGGIKTVKGGAKAVKGAKKLEGVQSIPKMSEKMPRTQTYQFPKTKYKTYSNTRTQKLRDKLDAEDLDAFEELEIRRELENMQPEWDEFAALEDQPSTFTSSGEFSPLEALLMGK